VREFAVLIRNGIEKEYAMAEKQVHKCAHPGCDCPAAKDSKYCGAYCEGSANRPSIACNCGHAECSTLK
jgi:hypothetical protein